MSIRQDLKHSGTERVINLSALVLNSFGYTYILTDYFLLPKITFLIYLNNHIHSHSRPSNAMLECKKKSHSFRLLYCCITFKLSETLNGASVLL